MAHNMINPTFNNKSTEKLTESTLKSGEAKVGDLFREYAESTTLHGIKHVTEKPLSRRYEWYFTLLGLII